MASSSSSAATAASSAVAAELAVAKAALTASLFRPDPVACSRDQVEHFIALVNAALSQCSPPNIQRCKQWALQHIVPSASRTAVFAKYLAAVSASSAPTAGERPSAKRKRLHILYLLNDLLFHAKFRMHEASLAPRLEAQLPALFRCAASFTNAPKQAKKLRDLVDIWEDKAYFPAETLSKLRTAIDEAQKTGAHDKNKTDDEEGRLQERSGRSAPFILPAIHGDPTMAWYDLPAGNWLPVLEPNSTKPLNPAMIKPLQLAAGPADKSLAEAVEKLLVDVDRIYDAPEIDVDGEIRQGIDQMGERILIDEIAGDVLGGESYYGWSREFCAKMKRRHQKTNNGAESRGRDSSRSSRSSSNSPSRGRPRSQSSNSSRPAFKRRRSTRSPSSSRSRSRGYRKERSPSRGSPRTRKRRRDPSTASSRDARYTRRSRSRGRSASPAYSPPPADSPANSKQATIRSTGAFPYGQAHAQHPAYPPFPPIPPQVAFAGVFNQPLPPPPPNYQGPWPPPPPPPPPQSNQGAAPFPFAATGQFAGGWPVPPPPPPPAAGGFQQGRGNGPGYWGQENPQPGYRGGGRGW